MSHDRLDGFEVLAVTFSDELELSEFREAFAPTYPIHRISESAFNELVAEYPGAIWFKDGELAGAWTGRVPSHRELSDLGGYGIVSADQGSPSDAGEQSSSSTGLFGGTASGRH